MAVKDEVVTIVKDVAKGLISIPFPSENEKKTPEYTVWHYCEKCKRSHPAPNP